MRHHFTTDPAERAAHIAEKETDRLRKSGKAILPGTPVCIYEQVLREMHHDGNIPIAKQ